MNYSQVEFEDDDSLDGGASAVLENDNDANGNGGVGHNHLTDDDSSDDSEIDLGPPYDEDTN